MDGNDGYGMDGQEVAAQAATYKTEEGDDDEDSTRGRATSAYVMHFLIMNMKRGSHRNTARIHIYI